MTTRSNMFQSVVAFLFLLCLQLYFSSEWAALLEVSFRNFIAGAACGWAQIGLLSSQ